MMGQATTAPPAGDPAYTVAVVHAQRVVRGFLGRLRVLLEVNRVYEKIFDPKTHEYYYYNTRTFATTWQPPAVVLRILGECGDLENIAPTYTEEEASVMIQTAWRRRQGLRILRALLASVVTKVLDESTGAHYYFNSLTGETSWSKPAFFGSEDVETYSAGALLARNGRLGQDDGDPFGTGNYGYDQSEATSRNGNRRQSKSDGAILNTNSVNSEYEGWIWDDSSGWYYDHELAAKQQQERQILAESTISNSSGTKQRPGEGDDDGLTGDEDSGSGNDSDSSESGDSDYQEDGTERKRRRKRRALPSRRFPRSRGQRLVDEAEDSMHGARPELLDLSMLDMVRVTSRVYDLKWLRGLDLSHNRLTRISPDLASMRSLTDLNLRQNRIRAIPDDLEALSQLMHLRLGYNRIRGFRGNIYLMSSLQTLDLEYNRFKEMPLQVGDLQLLKRTREWEVGLRLLGELTKLDLSHNLLEAWPTQVEGCGKLQDLRLSHNRLKEMQHCVGDNTALTSLNVSYNAIVSVPESINSLSSLIFLDLSHNALGTHAILPVGRKRGSRMLKLETLRLESNRLTIGPAAVETFKTLTDLNVSNNPITGWALNVSRLRKLKHLQLSGVSLEDCPEGIGSLDKLETLDLSANCIETLDPAMSNLFKLKRLDLRGNRIKDLGPCVGSWMSLTYLDLGNNSLEKIALELSRCTSLTHLDVSGGKVESLPSGLSKLIGLTCLRARDNRLMEIPAAFEALTALQELRVDINELKSLPESLQALRKIKFAELSRNRMESPPAVTRQWPLLKHLVLSRNPLRGVSRQSRRLLQAAQRGHDAMHRGDYRAAVQHLNVAANAYDDAIHIVPDFPDASGRGPPLAKTRPHDTDAFHHTALGVAHLQMAREVDSELDDITGLNVGCPSLDGTTGGGSVDTAQLTSTDDGSTLVSVETEEREERIRKELHMLSLRETRNHHYRAASNALSHAESLEQLSRPVGQTAGVWLARATVAASMGDPAAALDDLERVTAQLRKDAKVRALLAKSRVALGQYDRGLTDCRVAARLLDEQTRLLDISEAEQKQKEKEAAAQAASDAAIRAMEERMAVREQEVAATAAGERAQQLAPEAREDVALPSEPRLTGAETEEASGEEKGGSHAEASMTGAASGIDRETEDRVGQDRNEEVVQGQEGETSNALGKEMPSKSVELPQTALSVITEEAGPEPADDGGPGNNVTPTVITDVSERILEEGDTSDEDVSLPQVRPQPPDLLGSQASPAWEGPEFTTTAITGGTYDDVVVGKGGTTVGGNNTGREGSMSQARLDIQEQRATISDLITQAETGETYIKQSVDVADILRGFTVTTYGVPVRDTDGGSLLQGRSVFRDRYRRLMAVEAAKKRERARDMALMNRARRQVDSRQQSGKIVKARQEQAMAKYREIEEAWERRQDGARSATRNA